MRLSWNILLYCFGTSRGGSAPSRPSCRFGRYTQVIKTTERSDVRPRLIRVLQKPDSAFSTYRVVDLWFTQVKEAYITERRHRKTVHLFESDGDWVIGNLYSINHAVRLTWPGSRRPWWKMLFSRFMSNMRLLTIPFTWRKPPGLDLKPSLENKKPSLVTRKPSKAAIAASSQGAVLWCIPYSIRDTHP